MTQLDQGAAATSFVRFGRVERTVHWANATLFLFLLVTGFSLYGAPGFRLLAHRGTVKALHLWVGYTLPIPVLLGIATRAGRQLRDDFKRFGRWTADDSRWWRRRTRPTAKVGKFNPGQKLNAAFVGACIVIFPITGTVMRWANVFPLWMRSGADFTHSWFAIFLFMATVGHITMALSRPESMRGILRGKVSAHWAKHEHPRWHAEMLASVPDGSTTVKQTEIVSDEVVVGS